MILSQGADLMIYFVQIHGYHLLDCFVIQACHFSEIAILQHWIFFSFLDVLSTFLEKREVFPGAKLA